MGRRFLSKREKGSYWLFHRGDKAFDMIVTGKKTKLTRSFDFEVDSLVNEQLYDWEYPSKKIIPTRYIPVGKSGFVIGEMIDGFRDEFKIYASASDGKSFSIPRLVFSHPFDKSGSRQLISENKYDIEADWFYSQDSSKIVFANQTAFNQSDDDEQLQIVVFDTSLNVLWEKIIDIPVPDDKFVMEHIIVSNDGKVVCLTGVNIDHRRHQYTVYKITEETQIEEELRLARRETITTVFPFFEDDHSVIQLCGLYSIHERRVLDLKRSWSIHGVFMIKLNSSNLEFLSSNQQFFDTRCSSPFTMKSIQHLDNGNIHFLFDSKIIRNKRVYAQHGGLTGNGLEKFIEEIPESYFASDDLLSFMYFPEEDVFSFHKVEKISYQQSNFLCFSEGNEVYLIFNSRIRPGDKDQFHLNTNRTFTFHIATYLYHFNGDGELVAQHILSNSKEDGFFLGQLIGRIGDGKISIFSKKFKNSQISNFSRIEGLEYRFGEIDLRALD